MRAKGRRSSVPTQMSQAPKQHIASLSPTGTSTRALKTWNSSLNIEHTENPSDKVILEKSEEKLVRRQAAQRNFASNCPGSRLLQSRVPASTQTIDLDDSSDAYPNTSSAPPVTHAAGQIGPHANLSSSESDDDENEHSAQPLAKIYPRKSSKGSKKLRRASSSLSLDSCDSEALNSEPFCTKKNHALSKRTEEQRRRGTNQAMGLGLAQHATTESNSGKRPEPLIKKKKLGNCASGSNMGGVRDVGSRATSLLLQQQEENLLRKAYSVSNRALRPASAKDSNPPPRVGKCLLCNTHGVLLTDDSICRFKCQSSGSKASAPTSHVANSPGNKNMVKVTTSNASHVNPIYVESRLPSAQSRSDVPVSKATTKALNQNSSEGSVLGKRDVNGEPKPTAVQAAQNGARYAVSRKELPLINLSAIREKDAAGKDRFLFFAYRPKRFDFPRDSSMTKFSPFASAAVSMEGVSSTDVCSVCGSSCNLVACERCPLAFHKYCHFPPLQDSVSKGFLCRGCKSVKGSDKSSAYMPPVRLEPLPPLSNPLAHLAADAALGNPVDMVLHPSLHSDFIRLYKTDWLRCNRCRRLRVVGQRSLSESVHLPFECADAFWTAADQRSCGSILSASEQSQVRHVLSKMRERSKRRARLFYYKFGEKDRTSYGFLSPDEVVVLDDADDAVPPDPARKRTGALSPTPSPKPSVVGSQSQTVNAPVDSPQPASKTQTPGPIQRSSPVQSPPSQVSPSAPKTVGPESPKKVVAQNDLTNRIEHGALNSNQSALTKLHSGATTAVQRSTVPNLSLRSSPLADDSRQRQRHSDGLEVSVPVKPVASTQARIASPTPPVPTTALSSSQHKRALSSHTVAQSGHINEQRGLDPTGISLPNDGSRSAPPGAYPQAGLVSSAPVQTVPIDSNPAAASGVGPQSRVPVESRGLVLNNYAPSAAHGSQPPPLNPVQNVILPSSRAVPPVTTQRLAMVSLSSPVQHIPAVALNVQPGSILGQQQQQRIRPIQGPNVAQLAPAQYGLQNVNFERAQHIINSTHRQVAASSPPVGGYDVREVDMVQVGNGGVVPVTYGGPAPNQNQVSRGFQAWNGPGCATPTASASGSVQQDLLNKIAAIGESAEVEDTLVDLAIANNPTLIQIFNAFQGNPSRFGRQAVRLARSLMANSGTNQRASAPINGSSQANGSCGPIPAGQHRQLNTANGITGPVTLDIQAGYAGSFEQMRTLTQAEKHALNEKFRQLRILQIQQCIRLENCMAREMSSIPTQSIPQLHAAHNKAKKRMITSHAEQLRILVQSLAGTQAVAAINQQ